MKHCPGCDVTKEFSEFGTDNKRRDKLNTYCRPCRKISHKNRMLKNPTYYQKFNVYDSHRFNAGKHSAKRREIPWLITLEQWKTLIKNSRCHYCNGELSATGCGLDRKSNDKTIGYVATNVVPCCWGCNDIRGDIFEYEEFLEFIATPLFIKVRSRYYDSRHVKYYNKKEIK